MSRFRVGRRGREWLGLSEASRMLGVAPGTLRRWSDSGQISAFTTPGGHRRFRRTAIERLLPADRVARPLAAGAGVTSARLARAYRQQARVAAQELPWLMELSDEQREWFRVHGRVLAQAVLGHLDAGSDDAGQTSLAAATAEAAEYGRVTARLGLSLSQAVEGFLQFRRPFLNQLGLFCRRRALDTAAATGLMTAAERVMDRLLIAVMTAQSVARVDPRRSRAGENEGLA